MGSEAELDSPKLPLFSVSLTKSNEASGYLTPPLYSSVSVPFTWEEEPGKPRPCTNLVDLSNKCLELPPRLFLETQVTKRLSPTTVLEGPYNVSRSRFESSSFRVVGDYDHGVKEKGWFDSLRRRVLKGRRDNGGDDCVFSSSVDGECSSSYKVKNTWHRRARSFSCVSHSRPQFWVTICQGLKHVVPMRCKERCSKHYSV